MPRYVKIRRKSNHNITRDINEDIWKVQVERFKGKEYDWEEVYPAKVTILRRSDSTENGEKKSADVAASLTPIVDKVLEEIPKPEFSNVAEAEIKEEPKKRGRPRIEK